ncbi:hypothetical protein [Chitinivorax sp. B]|uniref:hypothetical protein n=1 Tax=Chitinivorax sp. B TaxID=2502235 RepID=UPI0010F4E1F5|nr:hypothetical protein [Chitinivorax sp. B]
MLDTSSPLINRKNSVLGNTSTRAFHNLSATLSLLPFSMNPDIWIGLSGLQQATVQKLVLQQQDWLNNWHDWWHSTLQLSKANTTSKLFEQGFNLTARMVQIWGDQVVDMAELQENFEVNYGYWASQYLPHNAQPTTPPFTQTLLPSNASKTKRKESETAQVA